jgi:cytochrome c553
MKRRLLKWVGLALLLALAAFLVMASGIISIPASSKHWALTYWILDFTKRRSVATHTLGGDPLKLHEEWMVLKGAGHYLTGCQPCHGSPGTNGFALLMKGATPSPPYLPDRISRWEPDELFYIVKHGIKFTGMPAWPALQRDDEVRAMTAFLTRLPSLDAQGFDALVYPAPGTPGSGPARQVEGMAVPRAVVVSCARCHGSDGGGRGAGAFPKLAGQRREYLLGALDAYARGQRYSGLMQPLSVGLPAEERTRIADYYAALQAIAPSTAEPGAVDPEVERGRSIAHQGIPEQRVPICIRCHGPKSTPVNPNYPSLAGQYREYLLLQMKLFKQGQRGGGKYAHLMHEAARGLREDQMSDVAAYFASLPTHSHSRSH